jgi:putative acyl-CoA dehydrogenase
MKQVAAMPRRVLDNGASNQPRSYVDVDLFTSDRALQDAVAANGAAHEAEALAAFGRRGGPAAMFDLGWRANEQPPVLEDNGITRFDPAYHQFMRQSIAAGLHNSTWTVDGTAGPPPAQVARAARFYMAAQVETGHLCPLTMTRAAVAALAAAPGLAPAVIPKIASCHYDNAFKPWWEKSAITVGMGMTEKQGGTDVRANTTIATRSSADYAISGHKWFMSAPMCDGFLVLAQAPAGLTCFFMPRFRPDGSINGLQFQRLKDKLGNRSNASSEVEFHHAFAQRVGEEGKGIATILQMVQLTRLDCAVASAGLMRMALAQAIHHASHRMVFQRRLIEQPMMRNVLADMAIEVEAATALVLRLCRSFDRAATDPAEAMRARLLTPAVKYSVCKTAPALVYEAMECLGGNGYVEDSLLPRLYREAPVNAIWEGSGNVMCLDVLRVLKREPEAAEAAIVALAEEADALPGVREAAGQLVTALSHDGAETEIVEAAARATTERLAVLAAAAALRTGAPSSVSESFARTRLGERRGPFFGDVPLERSGADGILQRALGA